MTDDEELLPGLLQALVLARNVPPPKDGRIVTLDDMIRREIRRIVDAKDEQGSLQ